MGHKKCNRCKREATYKIKGKWWCCLHCELGKGIHSNACNKDNEEEDF